MNLAEMVLEVPGLVRSRTVTPRSNFLRRDRAMSRFVLKRTISVRARL
jgi:hypothetical protein